MKILLGIAGGIAAYKAPEIVRHLRESGAEVQIVMTASAEELVPDTAFQGARFGQTWGTGNLRCR